MKRIFILTAAAAMALTACSKVETINDAQREISFQVANYLETRASGSKYENGAFGSYAWYNGSDPFMVNERVNLAGGVWKTVDHPFYWPKTGGLDFISYSPFVGTSDVAGDNPKVTANSITFTDFTASDVDLMVADKVTCSSNVDNITDDADGTADSGYNGVPTMFRHTLAKIGFQIKANFLDFTDANGNTTTWEIKVDSLKLSNIYTKGSLTLTWDDSAGAWQAPTDSVWTISETSTTSVDLITSPMTLTTEPQDLASVNNYIIPQALLDGSQTIRLKCSIHTDLPNGHSIDETYDSGELALVNFSSLDAWKMNQNILYTINIKPTATSDPDNPGHNDDTPEDVTILFDPAIDGWENVETEFTIQL